MMKRRAVLAGIAVALLSTTGAVVLAQDEAAATGRMKDTSRNLRLRRIDGLGTKAQIKPPVYDFRGLPKTSKPLPFWGRITVLYDTNPEWIDRLTVTYHVLMKTDDRDAETPYALFEGAVTYMDVARGKDHKSTIFLRPTTMKRYGEVVGVGVEITYEDEKVEMAEQSSKARVQRGRWWLKVAKSDKVTTIAGQLLDRGQTPFALANYVDFETIVK